MLALGRGEIQRLGAAWDTAILAIGISVIASALVFAGSTRNRQQSTVV